MRIVQSLLKISFLMLTCLFLNSCNNTLTYDYLVMHPAELQTAYSACQINDTSSCVVIKQAAHDVGEVIYEQTSNPELFGKKIMVLQQQLQIIPKNTEAERKIYDEKFKKLQMMYAVLGSQGPE
jgi:hypothetical protein